MQKRQLSAAFFQFKSCYTPLLFLLFPPHTTMTNSLARALKTGLAIFVFSMSAAHAQQGARLPVTQLTAGMHVIKAEVAATDPQRSQGLMFREQMGANEGMVFLFPEPTDSCMWMKNTPLPLSVAFIDANSTIVNIADMKPHSTDSHCATSKVRYALEMNVGWFAKRGIKAGSRIDGLPPLK